MKSVFLVKTPLQLLNAVEAKHFFKLNPDDCILIIMGDRKSLPKTIKLANDMHEWGEVIILNNTPLFIGKPFDKSNRFFMDKVFRSKFFTKSIFNARRLNRISRFIGEVENIFIGYGRYVYMKHFVNITPHNKLYLLDDGNATTQIAIERRDGSSNCGLYKKIKLFFKRYFQGIKDSDYENITFFTIYNISPGKNDQVINNNFDYIRSLNVSFKAADDVYFLGSPLSESGIITQQDYLKHLRRVNSFYKDKNIVYIAHRRESAENLEEIKHDLNIEVVLFDYPIEYQIAMIGPRPDVLASFVSSGLDSCRKIFGDQLKIVSFVLDLKGTPRQEEIESIYKNYKLTSDDNFVVKSKY